MDGADSSKGLSVEFAEKGKSPKIVEDGDVVGFATFPVPKFPAGAANGVFPESPKPSTAGLEGETPAGSKKASIELESPLAGSSRR